MKISPLLFTVLLFAGLTSSAMAQSLLRTDSRVLFWTDPTQPWSSLPQYRNGWQAGTNVPNQGEWSPNRDQGDPSKIPSSGLLASAGNYTLERVADPANGGKTAYRHTLRRGYPSFQDGTTYRSELNGPNPAYGTTYWVSFAFYFDSNQFAADSTNYSMSIMDMHETDWMGAQSSIELYTYAGGGLKLVLRSANNPYTKASQVSRVPWTDPNPARGTWHKFVMQFKPHYDPAQRPFLKLWRKVGSGPMLLIVNDTQPNVYATQSKYVMPKFGLYQYAPWGSVTTRVLHTKGMQILRDAPGATTLNENSMMSLIESF